MTTTRTPPTLKLLALVACIDNCADDLAALELAIPDIATISAACDADHPLHIEFDLCARELASLDSDSDSDSGA